MRLFFEVAYKGTHYRGWQKQNNAKSIQEEINHALSTICRSEIEITGSGRTDAGVHCEQQFFHADVETTISNSELLFKLNNMLPFDIAINSIKEVTPEAHARFDAVSRSYEYRITAKKDAFNKELKYYFHKSLNIENMNRAAALLTSVEQDFECFSKVKTEVNNFRCTITEALWKANDNSYVFHITANRFLRGMVRAIVGTLIEVGLEKKSIEEFSEIILKKDRKNAGRSVPAEGLFLTKVKYPATIFL